jgi:hypothetical protein
MFFCTAVQRQFQPDLLHQRAQRHRFGQRAPSLCSMRASISRRLARWTAAVGGHGDRRRDAIGAHRRAVVLAQRQLGLGLEHGERRAQLVRGVGDEAALAG